MYFDFHTHGLSLLMVFSLCDWEIKISCDTNLRSISLSNSIKEFFVHIQIQLPSLSQKGLF